MGRRPPGSIALAALLAAGVVASADTAGAAPKRSQPPPHATHGKRPHAPTKPGAHAAAPVPAAPRAPAPVAAPAPPAPPAPPPLVVTVSRATLENGLRVVIEPDHAAETVAVAVTYDAGSREDDRGRSGLAHTLEHMMFDGSANVGAGEHERLVAARGGRVSSTTTIDRAAFVDELPAGELPLALWLEADRMKSLAIDAASYDRARRTIEAERRARVDLVPYATGQLRLRELVFQGSWAWEHDPIGSPAELAGAPLEAARAFHRARYAPNHAVVTIVGDVDADDALELVHRFFDTAKRAPDAAPAPPPHPPEQTGTRTAASDDAVARTPGELFGWLGPETGSPAHAAASLALDILGAGEGSRLWERLVRERALARNVDAWCDAQRGPDLLAMSIELESGARLPDVEKLVDAELAALARTGPSPAELARAKERARSRSLLRLDGGAARAVALGEAELFGGDASQLGAPLARTAAVTEADVRDAAARWLQGGQRSRVVVRPPAPVGAPAAPREATPAGKVKTAKQVKAAKPAKKGKKP